MFIDELTIHAKAGDGGDGVERWRHEKNNEFGGPSGGNGGKGGDVYIRAVRDVHLLAKYRTKKIFQAEDGADGKANSLKGENGDDLEILLPVGSVVTDTKTGEIISLHKEGEKLLLLSGGTGGRGNESYKSATNQYPKQTTKGKPGQEGDFFIAVEMIADVGLVGLPNAGKTTLQGELTKARGKVGDYPFTTLEPSLGDCHGYIIADVPGLVEGASEGKGLGHKFLRHIRRTGILVHLVSLEHHEPLSVYKTFRSELQKFDPELVKKKEILLLTKADLAEKEHITKAVKELKKENSDVTALSLHDKEAVKAFQDDLIKVLEKIQNKQK